MPASTQTKKSKKIRLDLLLFEKGHVESREKAQALIAAGKVYVDDVPVEKAGKQVARSVRLKVLQKEHPYVSRGGVKLESALKNFDVSVEGLMALDIGASTGGFTDCLLRHGAKHVIAVDVGYGQLAWSIRQNPHVTVMERTNIRHLSLEELGASVDLIVIDVSFISLKLVFPKAYEFLKSGGILVTLVKPQFEVNKSDVGKRGKVSNEAAQREVLVKIAALATEQGFEVLGESVSAITGKKSGNREFFLHLKKTEASLNGSGSASHPMQRRH